MIIMSKMMKITVWALEELEEGTTEGMGLQTFYKNSQ